MIKHLPIQLEVPCFHMTFKPHTNSVPFHPSLEVRAEHFAQIGSLVLVELGFEFSGTHAQSLYLFL